MKKKKKLTREEGLKCVYRAVRQLKRKRGPIYEKWKSRWEASTGMKLKEVLNP